MDTQISARKVRDALLLTSGAMLNGTLVISGAAFLVLAEPQASQPRWSPFNCVRLQRLPPVPVPLSSPKHEEIYVLCRDSYDPTWPEV